MSVSTQDHLARPLRAMRVCLLVLGGLVVLKYLALLAEFDWEVGRSPFMLLVVVALPVLGILWLSRRRPRAAASVAGALLLLFVVAVVLAVVRDGFARESWADYPSAYGGLLVSAVGLLSSGRVLLDR